MLFKKPPEPEEFYIGYHARSPVEYKKFIRLVIFALLVVMYFTISFTVTNQRGFSAGIYQKDKLTELQGVLVADPFPAIRTFYGKDLYGNPTVKTIPLVNYGKFGADPIIQNVAAGNNGQLADLWVKLRGKLIYRKGVALLELAEKEKSILQVRQATKQERNDVSAPVITVMDSVTLQGQIIDPKCYFGVMKPGEGKPHSDCAIRCIAGGIQPMLMIRNRKGEESFFILRDTAGRALNNEILSFVGFPVLVKGNLTKVDDWWVLHSDPSTQIALLHQ
ncbi:MAG: hypothetical protein K1X61_10000 [Chitinophagales bacterium]|nr:hypothetical protein [Chitinophagales bacterium]